MLRLFTDQLKIILDFKNSIKCVAGSKEEVNVFF